MLDTLTIKEARMKRIFLILVLVSSLAFTGFAENTEKQTPVLKNNFQFKPALFLQFPLTAVIINPIVSDYRKWGLTLFGVDATIFKCGKWNFLGIGGGIASCFKKLDEPYYSEPHGYWDHHLDTYIEYPGGMVYYDGVTLFYLKLIPVKFHLGKQIYVELSITTKKMIVFGFTMNLDAFRKSS